MRSAWSRRLTNSLIALGLAFTLFAGGCAEPEDIDRVQPDLIDKSTLTGEWHVLDTVVRAPYASSWVFTGLQGVVERGVWEFEEKYLYFYRTYEFVEGVETQGIKGDTDAPLLDENGEPVTYEVTLADGTTSKATRYIYRSSPIARYAVKGHVDVRRSYNAVTGLESNVTVENSSDNFWWERDFARVDFGKDSAFHAGRFGLEKRYLDTATLFHGESSAEELALRVQDDGMYMDFVTTHYLEAPRMYFGGWGFIPTCLFNPFFTGAYYECDLEEVHIRTSFRRVDPDNSYIALNYDDHALNKFGFYRSARGVWNENYGITYSNVSRPIRRFRLWEEYLQNEDGTMDFAAMVPKPVVYYLSEDFPRELIPGALDLADQWSEPFAEVVETLSGKAIDHPMFVLCENNLAEVEALQAKTPNGLVASTDSRYCQDMTQPKYLGDFRYNMLVSVNDPTQYGLYGYGPMNSDPITGETLHANAFNFTGNIRLGARTAVDMIEYAAGVQNYIDVTQAQHITTSIKAKRIRGTQADPVSSNGMTEAKAMKITQNLVPSSVADVMGSIGFDATDVDLARAGLAPIADADEFSFAWLHDDMAAIAGLQLDELDVVHQDSYLSSLTHPQNFGTESSLLWGQHQDMARGASAICMKDHFDASFSGLALEYRATYDARVCNALTGQTGLIFDLSVFNEPGAACDDAGAACGDGQICAAIDQGDVKGKYCITPCSAEALLDQLRVEIRRVNQIDYAQYWDPSALYTDVKDEAVFASQQFVRAVVEEVREEVFLEVFDRMWSSIAMHEVGHNVGLRHNFASSTDALNYFPTYWDLKGTEQSDGSWVPNSRWDSPSDDEARRSILEHQQTSIMEYSSSFNARYQGLGSYDRAAILYGYGELVEVFDNPPAFSEWEKYLADPSDDDPTNIGLQGRRQHPLAYALRKVHHTNFPAIFGGIEAMTARTVVPAADLKLMAERTPTATELCSEQNGKVFPFRHCEVILDMKTSCTTTAECGTGQACQAGECFYDAASIPGVCCNTQPDHYTGEADLKTEFTSTYGITYFGNFEVIAADAGTARTEGVSCSAYDDPYDTAVCPSAGSFCRPFLDGFFCTKPEMVEVPFRFCSDEYNWTGPDCQTHDEGTDVFDMVRLRIDDYDAYWPFRAYQRDNALFNPTTTYWRGVLYHFQFMRKQFEHWAYDYSRFNRDGWWEKQYGTPWEQDVNGGLGSTLAAREIFTHMANVFGRPASGVYGFNLQKQRYEPVVPNGANTYSNRIELREDTGARPMYAAFDFSGYSYTPARAGTFYDRLAALMMLTYPRMMFVRGADTSYDLKRFRFNFATIFPTRMQNVLSGLLTSDPASFGWCMVHAGVSPTVGGDGTPLGVKPRMWFGTDEELDGWYENCTAITPEPEYSFATTQYRLPAVASIYGMGWSSATFDRTFMDRTRIWLKGEGNEISIPAGFETVSYTDPFSGKTYIAPYDPTEFDPMVPLEPRATVPSGVDGTIEHAYWPAAQMITTANELLTTIGTDNYTSSDLQQLVGRLEIVRGLYRYFEFGN